VTALEEFTLEEGTALEPVSPASPPAVRRRRASMRPATWVAIALAAVLLGVLLAPTTAPRASAQIPGWGGLDSIVVMSVEPDDDVLALARDAVDRTSATDENGDTVGSLVWAIRPSEDWLSTAEALEVALAQIEFPEPEVLAEMETLAPGSDWLCQEIDAVAECTALDGSAAYVLGAAP
jgi:hypothetical protein